MHRRLFADIFLLFFNAHMIIKLRYQIHDIITDRIFFMILDLEFSLC